MISTLALVLVVDVAGSVAPADAHGATTRPGSRTYLCRIDGTHASGDINPSNAACAAAVAVGGKQPLWDWFGVLRSDGAGRTVGYIPDGQLCSGGEPKFAGYDLPRSDWPYTSLTSGSEFTVRYNAWAAHPGEFRLYVTKDGYDPMKPLAWNDLEDAPFSVYNQNSPNGSDSQNGTPDYQWNVQLPNKSGQHIMYSVWSRSDSNETFYGCSDVRFDGGNGQVVGVGAGATPVGAPDGGSAAIVPTPATTVPPPATGNGTAPTTMTPTTAVPTDSTPTPSTYGADPAAGGTPVTDAGNVPAAAGQAVDTQGAGVAGTAASTDGAVAQPGAASAVEPFGDGSYNATPVVGEGAGPIDPNALPLGPPPQQQPSSGGGIGWIAIMATAIAGLSVGVTPSIIAFSSPRLRRIYRRLIGDEDVAVQRPTPTPDATWGASDRADPS